MILTNVGTQFPPGCSLQGIIWCTIGKLSYQNVGKSTYFTNKNG